MSMSIMTNLASLSSQNQLGRTTKSLTKTLGRISSGYRVNSASDDAAGLAVATNLETARTSFSQAMRNANDGISVVQTAEGATDEVTDILQRMRELATQSASETLADSERSYIQDEYEELADEIDRISTTTEFNGIELADGSSTTLSVQVGAGSGADNQIDISLGDLTGSTLGIDTASISMSSSADALLAMDEIDTALDTVAGYRAGYGATQNRLDSAINSAQNYSENLSSAESQIMDADFAFETSEMAKFQVMQQAGVAALAQSKGMSQSVLSLLM